MTRSDTNSRTEDQAGAHERATGPTVGRREHAEERGYDPSDTSPATDHEPCRKPGCLVCEELPKALDDYRAEQDADWWS